MIDRQEFYRAVGDYFGVPSDVTITSVDEYASPYVGCPTCGGGMDYEVTVTGTYQNGRRYSKDFDGRLIDFIESLD
jgi:hypothetical protein